MRNNLIKERACNKFTQVELAKKIGISDRQYQNLEAGTSNGTIPIWEKLRGILGKPIDYLLAQETDNTKEPDGNQAK